jgi:hypothetical protein
LFKARGVLSPAEGSLAHRHGFNIADLVLGDAPEEVENWSYGNTPFAVPQLSRIPQAKTTVVERDGKKQRKNRAFMAADAAAFAPFGALDNLAGGAAKGAIRLGGAPEAVASHTTRASGSDILRIRDKGLYAPSIGLTAKTPSDYQATNPHIVWRAGELDRQFPDSVPPGIFNRDAFVWNPDWKVNLSIKEQQDAYMPMMRENPHTKWSMQLADLLGDERFTQMTPDKGSHTASILASPKFRSLAEWETSPYGMGALESMGGGPGGLGTLRNYQWTFDELVRKHGLADQYGNTQSPALTQLLEQFPHLARSNLDLKHLAGSPLGDLFSTARNAPSAMGEMKIYAPKVPASPDVASIYLPDPKAFQGEQWADAGYDVHSARSLKGIQDSLAGQPTAEWAYGKAPIHLLAPSDGSAPMSAAEGLKAYKFFDTKGPSQVGAPGLKAPKAPADPFGQLVDFAEKQWKPPIDIMTPFGGPSKEKILSFLSSDYETKDLFEVMSELGVADDGTLKDAVIKIGKVLNIDGEQLHEAWADGSGPFGEYILKFGGGGAPKKTVPAAGLPDLVTDFDHTVPGMGQLTGVHKDTLDDLGTMLDQLPETADLQMILTGFEIPKVKVQLLLQQKAAQPTASWTSLLEAMK